MSDIGIETSIKIIENLRNRIKKKKIQEEEEVKQTIKRRNAKNIRHNRCKFTFRNKTICNFSSWSKWSRKNNINWKNGLNRLAKDGKKVVVAAADTFRAAAVEQLEIWAKKSRGRYCKKRRRSRSQPLLYMMLSK